MLVQCPNCKTTYKVSDEVVKGSSPAFRCSRCKHTFELGTEAEQEQPNERTSTEKAPPPPTTEDQDSIIEQALEQKEPQFTFAPLKNDVPIPEQPELPDIDVAPAAGPGPSARDDGWSIMPVVEKPEAPFTIAEAQAKNIEFAFDEPSENAPLAAATPVSEPDQDLYNNVLAIEPYRDQQASTTPFLSLFALLVIGFSLAAAYYQAHPIAAEDMVGKIPLVGRSVIKNNHLKNGVLLKSLEGGYQTIQGGEGASTSREVFVVTGTVVNQNSVVIRKVRLGGRLFNTEGKEIEQQAMWIGNAISPKIVRGLTAQDITGLQKLEPLRNFEIPPGDNVPFTLVFLKPNRAAHNFTCEVTAAEGSES